MFNLFDVTIGCNTLGEKPRSANHEERNAYLRWLADRDGVTIPGHATFGDCGIRVAGELIVAMPGYGDTRRATLEVLDDDGAVIRSTPIAIDTRGRMIMTAKQVQEATGLKPVKARKAAKRTPIAEMPAEPVAAAPQSVSEPLPTETAEPAARAEAASQPPAADAALDVVMARLAQLERQVSTLSRSVTPIGGKAPRSAAHERAVRRAWAERQARREAERLREGTRRALAVAENSNAEEYRAWKAEREILRAQLDNAHKSVAQWKALGEAETVRANRAVQKRRHAIITARATLSRTRTERTFQRQRGDVLHAQLVALRAAMADPSQPERASDLNRLMRERDEARNACAALEHRVGNMQTALEQVAAAVEEWSGRAVRAEAALRRSTPIAA